MNAHESTVRDAMHETNALLEHLLYHPNTAPFVAPTHSTAGRSTLVRVTSKRSPMHSAPAAGRRRQLQWRICDLAATITAILFDREARSATLDADPTHGQLREPIVKSFT